MAWLWYRMVEVPQKYKNQFNKFMKSEHEKLNRILQDDFDRFKRKLPKKYQNLLVARVDINL